MLIILTTLLGAITPFLPDLFKVFTSAADRKHELALMELRLKAGAQEHLWRMEEINTRADIAETQAIHQPMQSFGVQLLDKAHAANMPSWVIVPVFWAFGVLDWITGMVRPSITIAVVGFYMLYRFYCIQMTQSVIEGHNFGNALVTNWGENDWAILFMILAYWFGDRVRKAFKAGR